MTTTITTVGTTTGGFNVLHRMMINSSVICDRSARMLLAYNYHHHHHHRNNLHSKLSRTLFDRRVPTTSTSIHDATKVCRFESSTAMVKILSKSNTYYSSFSSRINMTKTLLLKDTTNLGRWNSINKQRYYHSNSSNSCHHRNPLRDRSMIFSSSSSWSKSRIVMPQHQSSRFLFVQNRIVGLTTTTTRMRMIAKRLATSNTTTITTVSAPRNSNNWWRRFAIVLRYIRIPVLIVSVYSLGYQQGIIDCIKEPISLQNQILTGILLSTGCTNMDDVNVIDDQNVNSHSFRRPDQVAIVGHKIIAAAREIVEAKLQEAILAVKATIPKKDDGTTTITPEMELLLLSSDPTVQFYYDARLRISGEQVEQQSTGGKNSTSSNHNVWQYILVPSSTPNAFVTEVLPRKFFITTAMFQVAKTPDELAVVLGHEISHLILGHISSTNRVETFLQTIEVLLLSMDPTAGLLSVFVIGAIYGARKMVSAAYSRENELQADDLGLEIAAAACYDTVAGCKVMYHMHQFANHNNNNNSGATKAETMHETSSTPSTSTAIVRLMDTHPPSLDRYERMLLTAQNGENYTKHINCAGIRRRLMNAFSNNTNPNTTTTIAKVGL